MGNPLPERRDLGNPERAERSKMKRRENSLSVEVAIDLRVEFRRGNKMMSSLGNTEEAHLAAWWNSKQKEDVKSHGQLPYYEDFQRYDWGRPDILRQVDR